MIEFYCQKKQKYRVSSIKYQVKKEKKRQKPIVRSQNPGASKQREIVMSNMWQVTCFYILKI